MNVYEDQTTECGQDQKVNEVQRCLTEAFPFCDDLSKRGGFHPHLTVGQFKTVSLSTSL